MLDLTNLLNQLQSLSSTASAGSWWLPGLVFAISLLGSMHCVGMCGGLIMALPQQPRVLVSYHLGRWLGYLSLGALAGLAGNFLLQQGNLLSKLSALLMALMFTAIALQIWRGQAVHFPLPAWLNQKLQAPLSHSLQLARSPRHQSWAGGLVGLLTVFLPCGWLYTFVLGAVMTRSLLWGAVYLSAFWLGTLPLLLGAPGLFQRWLRQRSQQVQRWVAVGFMLAGVLTLWTRFDKPLPLQAQPLQSNQLQLKSGQHCH